MTIAPWDFSWWANMAIRMRHFSWSWRVRKRMFEWLRTCRAMPSICSNQPGALLFRDLKKSPSWLLSKIFEDKSFHDICYAAPDIWSQWFWPSAAFGQRWIPWENIDSFVSSFSGGQSKLKHTESGSTMFHLLGCCRKHCHMQPFLPILSVKGNSLNSFQVKGSNRCVYILLVISFLVISCHFEGLYGFWGWNLTFVWTDELGHVLACSDILLKLIRFGFEVKSFRHAVDCTIFSNHTWFKGRKRFYLGFSNGFTMVSPYQKWLCLPMWSDGQV